MLSTVYVARNAALVILASSTLVFEHGLRRWGEKEREKEKEQFYKNSKMNFSAVNLGIIVTNRISL